MPIPRLLATVRAGLTPVLQAIQDLQRFHLVDWSLDNDDHLRLTATGSGTATAARAAAIQSDADRLLERSSHEPSPARESRPQPMEVGSA